ncbi:phosphoesterase [Gilbertella persicaria]|uniref:phosphoesterase n=1 Tax=Gilbertella persicaria TaxID=101096 RepID=UPI00221F59D0|nr:phosphoesterase [Gilbertella persicaria]KAI8069854.1 phosphoesterase [Gilbertella persicaria]
MHAQPVIKDYDTIASTTDFAKLQSEGILLTNFNAIRHPSQPNYIAAAAGDTLGVTGDGVYHLSADKTSIFDLLEKKGLTWKLYQEDIPSVGYTGAKSGDYVRKHNPAISFDAIANDPNRAKNIVGADQLQKDISANTVPNWMFFTPNLKNDGHDTTAAYAGKWLSNFVSSTLYSNPDFYKNTFILITFDETASYFSRNKVWSLLLGNIPTDKKGTTDNTFYSHYSTLNTVELNWGLGNLGRQDTNKLMSNVFSYAAGALGYTNMDVPTSSIPKNN